MDIKEIPKEIRTVLKGAFPATKFSVRISRYSMGSAVDVCWTDGPTTSQVDELIGRYGNSISKFITTSRMHSAKLVNKSIEVWKKQNSKYAHFTVTCKGSRKCYAEFNMSEFGGSVFNLRECESSLHSFLYHAGFDGTNLILSQENENNCEPETVSAPEPELAEVVTETTVQLEISELDAPVAAVEPTVDYVVAIYHSYSHPDRKNDKPEYFTLDKWRETVGQNDQLTAEAYGCLTSWNSPLERMTITAICCNLPGIGVQLLGAKAPDLQPDKSDKQEADTLKSDRQQAYAQYLASQQEADALEAQLSIKKTEAQVYFAIMKEIDEKIEAKKREAEVITTEQTQPGFDVRTLAGAKVTLILINTMGFPVCCHVTVIAADIVSAKRYYGEMTDRKCLELQYIEKGKRKPRSTRYAEADLAIALGWQDIFDTGLLSQMISQAKDVVYSQQMGQMFTATMIDSFA